MTTEFTNYQTAVMTFRDRYFALPGDMRNATDFWGAADGSTGETAGCLIASTTDGTTCNGNGNGVLEGTNGYSNEQRRFWEHLANAGLIEGSFDGANGIELTIGLNMPGSKLRNGSWYPPYRNLTSHGDFYDGDFGNTFQFGQAVSGSTNFGAVITPEEAWNVDSKLDDGKPGSGKVMAIHYDDCGGASGSTDFNSEYALSTKTVECALMFPNVLGR